MGIVRCIQPVNGIHRIHCWSNRHPQDREQTGIYVTCLIPLAYLYVTVLVAGTWMVKNVYWNPAAAGFNVLNGILSIIMLVLGIVILVYAIKKWRELWKIPQPELVEMAKREIA